MEYFIEPQEGKKGRSFRGTCVALVSANSLWEGSGSEAIRPVWAMFAGTDAELKPFMMNLKLGRKANLGSSYKSRPHERIEFLKSEGFYISWQREALGTLSTIYHPELFRLDPGMVDPQGLSFILLVPSDWEAEQKLETSEAVDHVKKVDPTTALADEVLEGLVPTAYLFAAYLDRRTRAPLIADGRFYLQLLNAALAQGLASFPGSSHTYGRTEGMTGRFGFNATGLEDVGISQAIACMTTHKAFEEFLALEVAKYFAIVGVKSKPVPPHVQYSLFKDMPAVNFAEQLP